MTSNSKQEALHEAVVELIDLEGTIERTLGSRGSEAETSAEIAEALRRFATLAGEHKAALEAYLASTGDNDGGQAAAARGTAGSHVRGEFAGSAALAEACGVLNEAGFRYGVLATMAFRLNEPPLRELAPKHLRDYGEATQAINQLIPPTVAAELRERGLECQCVCPLCTLGACGCVFATTFHINNAWREAVPPAKGAPGLRLQQPRPNSDLARAGFRGGEVLLAVEDLPIGEFRDVIPIQAAIRDHVPGGDLRLRVQRANEDPTEVRVSRSDGSPA
jgi:hypothetical protein